MAVDDRIPVLPTDSDGCVGGLANDSKLELPIKVQILMTVSEVLVTTPASFLGKSVNWQHS